MSSTRTTTRPRHEVYGWVNGEAVYSRDEFIFKARGRGPIDDDAELLEFARKKSSNWYNAGWHRKFEDFYLSDYALSEPYRSLTLTEFARLKELQAEAIAARDAAEEARGWEKVDTTYWADNSVEELWRDKNGVTKTVMVVGPHGDACF